MKAFTDLLYFEPKISMSDWPLVIEALKDVYPNIRWASGRELGPYQVNNPINQNIMVCNTLTITSINNQPLLTQGMWANKEDFARHVLGVNSNYAQIKDGWEHLGFKQDIGSIFDSLAESKLIRKIIKESMDEFDWVDVNPNLYDLISNFFKHEHPEYWLKKDFGHVHVEDIFIADKTGNYIQLDESEFTIENIREALYNDIIKLGKDRAFDLRDEYIQLAKVLEPIIGPINID